MSDKPLRWMWNPESDDDVLCNAADPLDIVLIAHGLNEKHRALIEAAPELARAVALLNWIYWPSIGEVCPWCFALKIHGHSPGCIGEMARNITVMAG